MTKYYRLMNEIDDWLNRTKRLRSEGKFAETIAFLGEVRDLKPNDASVFLQIAWTHDALGKETDAVEPYEKALELGLVGDDLESAYVGLGSTYRSLGDYENSKRVFEMAIAEFPQNGAVKAFYAMTLYNLGQNEKAMETLIKELVTSSIDPRVKAYGKALVFYSNKLGEIFD